MNGTRFRLTFPDGSVREGEHVVGAMLTFLVAGQNLRIRIDRVWPDPTDASGEVLLHDFRNAETGESLCAEGPDGLKAGFPLSGETDGKGRFRTGTSDQFELVCTSGAQGKCIRWGYHPWSVRPSGPPAIDIYNACIRMVRADYCGDGRSWTRDGTLIDIWDVAGIQEPETLDTQDFSFEAGWLPEGAACVAHPRIENHAPSTCKNRFSGNECNEEFARSNGAMLFNRSAPRTPFPPNENSPH